jgi:hypothetical protein
LDLTRRPFSKVTKQRPCPDHDPVLGPVSSFGFKTGLHCEDFTQLTGEESIVGGFCGHEQPYWTIEATPLSGRGARSATSLKDIAAAVASKGGLLRACDQRFLTFQMAADRSDHCALGG